MTLPNRDCDHAADDFLCRSFLKKEKFSEFMDEFPGYLPGQKSTEVGPGEICTHMVVQGICMTEEYLFLSAYCYKHIHTSVIYVLKKKTAKLWKVLLLGNRTHAGGIACDGEFLWVCETGSRKEVAAYRLKDCLKRMQKESAEYVDISVTKAGSFAVGCSSSFCTYWEGRLYVGAYMDLGTGMAEGYLVGKRNGKVFLDTENDICHIKIKNRAQGMAFTKKRGQEYMVLSRSAGRNCKKPGYISEICIYRVNRNNHILKKRFLKKYTLPPMVEEICFDNEFLYFVFESAAGKYEKNEDGKGRSMYPVNRICCKRDVEAFLEFICHSAFSVKGDFKKSWEFIETDMNSIQRYTNLPICFEERTEEELKEI